MSDVSKQVDVRKLGELHRTAAAVPAHTLTVALLYGGTSGEREVSIASGEGVRQALDGEGFTVVPVDTGEPDFIDRLRALKPDVAFIALHGKGGEDGSIQGFLETLDIPFTHSGVKASALALDKLVSKLVYQAFDLSTAQYAVVYRERADADAERALALVGLPCVVKPACDGSSLGISIPKTRAEFFQALEAAFAIGDPLLVEKLIEGVEVTVPVLGNSADGLFALPVIEIVPKNEFYDYESKYVEGGSRHIIPARITEAEAAACQEAAIEAHRILECAGVSRTDMIITADGTPCLIETNTVPGMTRTSLIPEAAREAGISAGELYRLLIHYALGNAEKLPFCHSARRDAVP
jgi:D-alanine-D-alanine ligase